MPLIIVRNDITKMNVDAIVNAANSSLLGGGGVDGAIHRAAGPELLAECRTLHGCKTGEAKLTRGYRLPAKYVIHTVGPVWQGGQHGEKALLTACYRNSLTLAAEHGCETVAFPLISSGIYGYPKAEALQVAQEAIVQFLSDHDDMTVYIIVFSKEAFKASAQLFNDVKAYIEDAYAEEQERTFQRSRLPQLEEPALSTFFDGKGRVKEDVRPVLDAKEMVCGAAPSLDEMLNHMDDGFSQALLRKIDEKGMTDAACYKRANVDRRLFNKIKNNPDYKPSKLTVLAFIIALELSLPEAQTLLKHAGFALSHSSKTDIVVEYCIKTKNYNIFEINQILFEMDLQLLGS